MLCRNGKTVESTVEGVPIGLLEDQDYDQLDVVVQPGDVFLLYSDGVEDQLSGDEEYGRERLEKLVIESCKKSPREIAKAIFDDLDRFRGATPLTDDQTVIVFKVL